MAPPSVSSNAIPRLVMKEDNVPTMRPPCAADRAARGRAAIGRQAARERAVAGDECVLESRRSGMISRAHADIRQSLEQRRSQLTDELRARLERMRAEGPQTALAEPLSEVENAELNVTMVEMLTGALHAVESALDRLDAGTYGWCQECGGRIRDGRLRAMPFAVRCRDCETERERSAATGLRTVRDSLSPRASQRDRLQDVTS
jgi:DnaK suppressor protein